MFDRNTLWHLTLVVFSVALSLAFESSLWLILYPSVFVVNEIADLAWGFSMFDDTVRVRRGYQWFNLFLDRPEDGRRDLTEGFFNGVDDKSVAQAMHDKYDYVIAALGLKPGDALLDIGCGYGQFIAYACSKGIRARGLTLSPQQASSAQSRGLDVICEDGRALPPALYGQFDAVTYFGCLEHFCPVHFWHHPDRQDRIYRQVFKNSFALLKPDSPHRRIFTTTLHRTEARWSLWDYVVGYFLQRHYGGVYPKAPDGLHKNSAPWFRTSEIADRTDDYRLTSVRDPEHFGAFSIRWTPRRFFWLFALLFFDPYALHKWGYHYLGAWMWQFGGRAGAAPTERVASLFWIVYQAVPVDRCSS